MKMLISVTILLVGIPQIYAGCLPNNVCTRARDTIIQINSADLASEAFDTGNGRTWFIKPQTNAFNIILAFKNFTSTLTSVMLMTYTQRNEQKIEYFYGNLSNFEVVKENVVGIVIYVPTSKIDNAEFVLNYYTGCEILTSTSGKVFSLPGGISKGEDQTSCWYIHPADNEDRKRIYVSTRDVSLNDGQRLAIWDVHTSAVIASAEGIKGNDLAAAESEEHQSVMIDLVCTKLDCSRKSNSFLVSYYTMKDEDIDCIETQKLCDEKDDMPFNQCNVSCPAFDSMVAEEYRLQVSGSIGEPGVVKKVGDAEIVREENTTEVNTVMEKKPTKRRRCPLPKALCRCRRNVDKHAFCAPNVDCLILGKCTFACIFHKYTTCIRIQLLNSLKLL